MRAPLVSRVLAMCALCLVPGLLAGCGESPSSAERAAEQGILLLGNNAEPQSLDPHKATAVADGKIISALLEGLVRPHAEDAQRVLPGMAERWEHNADASEWTFHLRSACWSDGSPVRAQDFAYAYRRMLHPQFGGRYAEMLYPLKGARAFNKGEIPWEQVGVRTPDAHTLVLSLEGPTPQLLRLLLHYTWSPLPEGWVEAHGGMLDRRSVWAKPGCWVGNGAYVLDEHRVNDYLSVVPNPHYWRASEVRNRGIRFLPIVNGYTETRMYFGGKLHITNNVPPELIQYAATRAPGEFCQDDYYCSIFYRLNTKRKPLDDPRVRLALSTAIDRQELVERVVRGAGTPATAFTPYAKIDLYGQEVFTKEMREEQARSLLAEAGYPGGKDFPTLVLMTTSRDVQRVMAESIQAMWAEVLGVHVELRSCEWTAFKVAQQNGDYDIASNSWSGDYLDPATFLELWQTDGGNNNTGWSCKEYDEWLEDARHCPDEKKRNTFFLGMEISLARYMPVIPLYWSRRTYLKYPTVRGWYPLLLDNHPLDAVEVHPRCAP